MLCRIYKCMKAVILSSPVSTVYARNAWVTMIPFLENIFCSIYNNALMKCANGKAFYIVAPAQFFTTLIQERLVVFGCCLLVAVMKFHHKFASLWQVNCSNSQERFQICCTEMYLVQLFVNFAMFCVFCELRGISQINLKFAAPRPREIPEAL